MAMMADRPAFARAAFRRKGRKTGIYFVIGNH
jgi:hypothetical protein